MGVYLLDVLFIVGLPRSGTSLVHNLVHESTGRKAPTFKDFGIDVRRVPRSVRSLNPTFKDETSLAEDNDFGPALSANTTEWLGTYRKWLEVRGNKWVLKSPDHLGHLVDLVEVFPEARFLWAMRSAGAALASMREYWQVTGLGPSYDINKAVREGLQLARAHTELIDTIWVPSIPEWESDREPIYSAEAEALDALLEQVRGLCRNVASRDFARYY